MTSVKTMFFVIRAAALAAIVVSSGCQIGPRLQAPAAHASPQATQRVWAVAPFINESGVSRVDNLHLADQFAYEIDQVNGLASLPVNRVAAAMHLLQIREVATEAEGIALLNVLDADGLVIGSVTSYDAFPPLRLGLSVLLITRERIDATAPFSPLEIARTAAGEPAVNGMRTYRAAEASAIFDASNHAVRASLDQYTRGRVMPDSAFGAGIYDVNMDLYTRFVSHQLIGDLLTAEQQRTVTVAAGIATQ